MFQKMMVGLLVLSVFGAVVIGLYDTVITHSDENTDGLQVLAQSAQEQTVTPATVNAAASQPDAPAVAQQGGAPQGVEQAAVQSGEPVIQAQDTIGDLWADTGFIVSLDDNGMVLSLTGGEQVYVELGPPHYWQESGVVLNVGEKIAVEGFFNGEQYHAMMVTKADGSQLALRTIDGQPLWSGGASQTSTDSTDGATAGQHGSSGARQVAPEDWVTFEATITLVNNSSLTVQTDTGDEMALQLGQARFVESQGIVFQVGDAITVLGFWQGEQFKVAEVTQLATGARLMLLDPNGRPLWAGPGRNGAQGQTQTQTTTEAQTQTETTTETTQETTTQTGQGQGSGGQGRGYRGGRQ